MQTDKKINKGDLKTEPVKFTPLQSSTEKQDGPVFTPVSPDKKYGYAVVGLGHLTLEEILPAFGQCKYSRLAALVSGDKDKATKVAAQYGISEKNIYDYTNFDSIRDNPEVDIVYIVLPNNMHEEYTIRAAKAGKHVLCEKPMAIDSAACQRMIDACKKADRKLMIGYRMQYEPHNRMLMQWTRDEKYGKTKIIESFNGQNQGDPSQWRLKKAMGGGALFDVGIYCLNTSRFLLGTEPESVLAQVYSDRTDERFKEVDETVMFQLNFPGGVLVNCTTSFGAHSCRRYRIYTDKGAWYGMDPAFDYRGLRAEMSLAKDKEEWKQSPMLSTKNHFALEMDHLAKCISENKQPYTPGEEGLQDVRIMEAIFQSAQEGKIVRLENYKGIDSFRGDKYQEG